MTEHVCESCGHPLPGKFGVEIGPRTIARGGVSVRVTKKQREIFEILLRRAGNVISREALISHLYSGANDEPDSAYNIISVYTSKLRTAIKPLGLEIRCHWGAGYLLEIPHTGGQARAA